MANRTVKDAHSIHGTNPQYLVEKIIRTRIYESKYWKEECFGLTGRYRVSLLAGELTLVLCPLMLMLASLKTLILNVCFKIYS